MLCCINKAIIIKAVTPCSCQLVHSLRNLSTKRFHLIFLDLLRYRLLLTLSIVFLVVGIVFIFYGTTRGSNNHLTLFFVSTLSHRFIFLTWHFLYHSCSYLPLTFLVIIKVTWFRPEEIKYIISFERLFTRVRSKTKLALFRPRVCKKMSQT